MTAEDVIEMLGLEPLPEEGGWFRETYRAGRVPAAALPEHGGDRSWATQIYYLLRSGSASKLHRVASDEVFHHYLGGAVVQALVGEGLEVATRRIGGDLASGERPQVIVPAGVWQGAVLASDLEDEPDPDGYALLGCTVSPGFEWDDFELVDRVADAGVCGVVRRALGWGERLL